MRTLDFFARHETSGAPDRVKSWSVRYPYSDGDYTLPRPSLGKLTEPYGWKQAKADYLAAISRPLHNGAGAKNWHFVGDPLY